MRYCLFLYYRWFVQNLEKGCIQINMHRTVPMKKYNSGTGVPSYVRLARHRSFLDFSE